MTASDLHDNFIIREYGEKDYDGIAQFWNLMDMGSPERGDSREIIERTIKMGGSLLVMEEKGTGRISGTSWMTFDGRRILLHHFGILPQFQGIGLSKILMKESLQVVKRKGFQVKLEVHSANFKAITLYKKFGFKHLGEYKVFIIR
ncbi:MAG: acetyltransferase, partial [Bacteroidetes bacterium]|nr:acetyltransferase [Bacteroidota bacterium]